MAWVPLAFPPPEGSWQVGGTNRQLVISNTFVWSHKSIFCYPSNKSQVQIKPLPIPRKLPRAPLIHQTKNPEVERSKKSLQGSYARGVAHQGWRGFWMLPFLMAFPGQRGDVRKDFHTCCKGDGGRNSYYGDGYLGVSDGKAHAKFTLPVLSA